LARLIVALAKLKLLVTWLLETDKR